MATYAIGDIQGCFEPLTRLIERLDFDPAVDRLWFAGDLVNRGPESLRALRLVKSLGEPVVSVLGNHDLHLLARAEGLRPPGKSDTMEDVLESPDRDELLDWVARRPFAHVERLPSTFTGSIRAREAAGAGAAGAAEKMRVYEEPELRRFALIHGGLFPEWSIEEALALAAEATGALRADRRGFLETIYGSPAPSSWSPDLSPEDKLRVTVFALVRMRALDSTGAIDDDFTGPPSEAPPGLRPWFDLRPHTAEEGTTIVFGHWAANGLLLREEVAGIDTGCVWGGALTALRLEDGAVIQVPARPM